MERDVNRGSGLARDCLDTETILSFVLEELSEEKEMRAAEHLAACPGCLDRVRKAQRANRIMELWTAPAHAEASRACQEEVFVPLAAATPGAEQPIVLEGDLYRAVISRVPDGWLLTVDPMDPKHCPDGAEIIVSYGETRLVLTVVNGCASALLKEAPDVESLRISCHSQDGP